MKNIFLVITLFFCFQVSAQEKVVDMKLYHKLIKKGKKLEQKGKYSEAIKYYKSAKDWCSDEELPKFDAIIQETIQKIEDERLELASALMKAEIIKGKIKKSNNNPFATKKDVTDNPFLTTKPNTNNAFTNLNNKTKSNPNTTVKNNNLGVTNKLSITEKGFADVVDDVKSPKPYVALHRTAAIGTLIIVKNIANNKTVVVEVIGKLKPDNVNKDIIVQITPSTFTRLGSASTNRLLPVEISYMPR